MFFARLSSDRARCVVCSRDICRVVSPDRLWAHLRARHDDVFRATDHFKSLPDVSCSYGAGLLGIAQQPSARV